MQIIACIVCVVACAVLASMGAIIIAAMLFAVGLVCMYTVLCIAEYWR